MTPDLAGQSADELFALFGAVQDELRRRGLVRSSNNPVADYAEGLAAKALGLTLVGKSSAGHDGVDAEGVRYQVKGRRLTPHNQSRQLSFMRNLDARPFDRLVGILFGADLRVLRACVVPYEVVVRRAKFSSHVNAHRLLLRDDVWNEAGVEDLTAAIVAASATMQRSGA